MRNTTSENLCYSKTHEVESVKLTKSRRLHHLFVALLRPRLTDETAPIPPPAHASHPRSAGLHGRRQQFEQSRSRRRRPGNQCRHRLRGRRSARREWRKYPAAVRGGDPIPPLLHSPSPADVLFLASRDGSESRSSDWAAGSCDLLDWVAGEALSANRLAAARSQPP